MFHHILVATDLSCASERAIDVAARLTRAHRARLTVVHVYEVSAPTLARTAPAVAERTWPGAARARAKLQAIVERLRACGLRAESALRFGSIRSQIVEAASDRGVDLIVMGTRGRRGLAHVWYGSVAGEIVRGSTVPVLAVPAAREATHRGRSGNVVRLRRA